MSMPTKEKADVLADPDAFREAYARACAFFRKFEGVVDVAFGQKRTGAEYKDNIAFIVYVKEKKEETEIPPEQRIPPSFEGYPTDVRVVRPGVAQVNCENTKQYEKIQGGIQIMAAHKGAAGTLGCIVKRRNDRGRENVYLLTNKHVLFSIDGGRNESVYHPEKGDVNLGPIRFGMYGSYQYPQKDPAAPLYFIDAAIARIDLDSVCCGSTCTSDVTEVEETFIAGLEEKLANDSPTNPGNTIVDVRDVITDPFIINTKVYKVGRTTGKTAGFVRIVNAPFLADPEPENPGGPQLVAFGAIYIEFDVSTQGGKNCKGNQRFTEPGDSGSIVLDENNHVIGLHTHSGLPAQGFTLSPSLACCILPVLDYLGICIPTTTGTSTGSSKATDGTGIEPAPLSASTVELEDGQIAFASQNVVAVPERSPGFPDPAPLADEEVRHMRELLRLLRETEKGRELHEVFGQLRREVGYLIRNCRPVKVVWHRNQGPAFFAHVLNHLKGHTDGVPLEVKGVSRQDLLERMAEALSRHGSNPLRRTIEQYREEVLGAITSLNSVRDCIAYLHEKEFA